MSPNDTDTPSHIPMRAPHDGRRNAMVRRRGTTVGIVVALMLAMVGLVSSPAMAETLTTTQAQKNLAGMHYYEGPIDGINGESTISAVRTFQGHVCVEPDGKVGPVTSGELTSQVVQIQDEVGAEQDGIYGPETASDVLSWQESNGLFADGIAGPDTMQAMGIARVSDCGDEDVHDEIVNYANAIMEGEAIHPWDGGQIIYSWGGGHEATPGPSYGNDRGSDTYCLDCSGFTRWVYSLAYGSDVLGAGGTHYQIQRMTEVSSPVPGDLVFFGESSTDTTHVGVYIGDGQMINAPDDGQYIQVSDVWSNNNLGYYRY